MTPEEMQAIEMLPQVGDILHHIGRVYECTVVEWERGEDEITVTYRRKWNDGSEPFKLFETTTATFREGQSATLTVVDELHTWRNKNDV